LTWDSIGRSNREEVNHSGPHWRLRVNAVSTYSVQEYCCKFYPPVCPLPHFFLLTLAFLDMFWVHVIHVLNMLQVLGGM
jgi:hypothetical protein